MWRVVEHSCTSGKWIEHGTFTNLSSGQSHAQALSASKADVFYFWAAKLPEDKAEQQKIFDDAFAANGDRLLRITLDVEFSTKKSGTLALCSGDCFCVVANGSRRCETQYCNDTMCWWVSCGSNC